MDGRLILAAIVLIGGLTVAVAGASPQSTLTPAQATDAEPGPASVKGMVADVDRANGTFTLTDGENNVTVTYHGSLPSAVSEGRSVVAEGTLSHAQGGAVLAADAFQIGCPSKYEA